MKRRSLFPPPVSGPIPEPSSSAPLASSKSFSLRFRRSSVLPPPTVPPRARRNSRSTIPEESPGVLDISPHDEETPNPGGAGREAEEERERRRLREEAAKSLGWTPSAAGKSREDDLPGQTAPQAQGSFLALGAEPAVPTKASKRHSIQALLSPSSTRHNGAHTSTPTPTPSRGTSPAQPQQARTPAQPRSTYLDRLYAQHGSPPPFPSPLSVFSPLAVHYSPVHLPPAPGLFGLRKPRPRVLLLSPQGQLHLFQGKQPQGKEKECERLDLARAGGSVTAVLLDVGRRGKDDHMLRVEGVSASGSGGGSGGASGKGGAGGRTSWTFACPSREEMGVWIRAIERILEGGREGSLISAISGRGTTATLGQPGQGSAAKREAVAREARGFELLKPEFPSPTISYPSAFAPTSNQGKGGRSGVPSPNPQPAPAPKGTTITPQRGKRQSLSPEALAAAAARPPIPISALPIGPARLSTATSRPSTAPSFRSFVGSPPSAGSMPGPPTVLPQEREKRSGSMSSNGAPASVRSPETIFTPASPLSPDRGPPVTAHQLGQHPFGASSTSLRDREIKESLPPPRRPRPGSASGRPLSPSPSMASGDGGRLLAPSIASREGGRTPEAPPLPMPMPVPVPVGAGAGPKDPRVDTANLSPQSSPRKRTPKRPSTAPSLSSPTGAFPPPLGPGQQGNQGSLKRRSGILPPLSPPPNHPIPALPIDALSIPSQPTNGRYSPGSADRQPRGERRMSAMSALPGPPTTTGTGGYVNGTRSRPGSSGGRTVRLLPDTPGGAAQELIGLGITSPNIQRRMTPPPRPPPTGALPAPPIDTSDVEDYGTLLRAQKHRSLPASPSRQNPSPPHLISPTQGPENVVGDSLLGGGAKVGSTLVAVRKMGESFFEGQSPDLEHVEGWNQPPRESSVLLGDEADRFWKEATRSPRLVSQQEQSAEDGGRHERPSQDSGELASTSTMTSFEAQPVSYDLGLGAGVGVGDEKGKGRMFDHAGPVLSA